MDEFIASEQATIAAALAAGTSPPKRTLYSVDDPACEEEPIKTYCKVVKKGSIKYDMAKPGQAAYFRLLDPITDTAESRMAGLWGLHTNKAYFSSHVGDPQKKKFLCPFCMKIGQNRATIVGHVQQSHYHMLIICVRCHKLYAGGEAVAGHSINCPGEPKKRGRRTSASGSGVRDSGAGASTSGQGSQPPGEGDGSPSRPHRSSKKSKKDRKKDKKEKKKRHHSRK